MALVEIVEIEESLVLDLKLALVELPLALTLWFPWVQVLT